MKKAVNQITKEEAQRLFEYRGGMLYWRHSASGMRRDRRAVFSKRNPRSVYDKYRVRLGGRHYAGHYLVWNWHNGIAVGPVEMKDVDGGIGIENLREAMPASPRPQYAPNKYVCPCCEQRVASPTPDILAELIGLPPIQEAVLRAVWAGKGRPVQPEAIFTEMYSDDPDGGPGSSRMYAAFKVALCHLREKLKGTGVSIENVGYRQGYRLIMKEARK